VAAWLCGSGGALEPSETGARCFPVTNQTFNVVAGGWLSD